MARTQTVITSVTDDIDGSDKNVETVAFTFEGQAYEIDLGPKNTKAIHADFAKWTQHARKARKTASTGRGRKAAGAKAPSEAAAIRQWAAENGIDVPARGRIPAAIAEQYHAE